MRNSTLYILVFAAIMCVLCGVVVSSAAVSLKKRQDINAALDKKKNVLEAAGLVAAGESIDAATIEELFASFEAVLVDLETGEETTGEEALDFDQRRAAGRPESSREAPPNLASVRRIPDQAQVFKYRDDSGALDMIVLPIEGLGLWGTLYGFLALDADGSTVRGLTYYQHKETPGLGGEVDNPRWKALWPGRKIHRGDEIAIEVIKGQAGPVETDPHRVDGLAGATITSRGVTRMIEFWLGENGFGSYLAGLTQHADAGSSPPVPTTSAAALF